MEHISILEYLHKQYLFLKVQHFLSLKKRTISQIVRHFMKTLKYIKLALI